MTISCEEYYEKYLGDSCNNKCENCFAEKEIYIVKEEFEVCGESVIHKVNIPKGSWWWIMFENTTHVCLTQGDGKELRIIKEMFDKYFYS